jgi:hypothetical protein
MMNWSGYDAALRKSGSLLLPCPETQACNGPSRAI